jgi:hypothetical protein
MKEGMDQMLCPYCNAFRPANKAPCPQCKALSPLVKEAGGSYHVPPAAATWGGPITPGTGSEWNNQGPQGSFQREAHDNTLWGQVMGSQAEPGHTQQQYPSMLPVPYQGGVGAPQQTLKVATPDLPTIHTGTVHGTMAPAIPGEDEPIFVPPMYTKPRAIIPPYRAISGLISFIVVLAMLCTGAGFYAKATGKLSFLHQVYGDARPENIKLKQPTTLPVPQTAPNFGPASTIINSATTASKIDEKAAQPISPTNQFKVGDTIYLTYSVHPKSPGTVTAKWYTNDNPYQVSDPISIKDPAIGYSGYIQMQFLQPLEGKVELYWNDQLAVTLFFVVEPVQP